MTFDPENQPNVHETFHISALFRTPKSPKCLGIKQLIHNIGYFSYHELPKDEQIRGDLTSEQIC